VAVRVDDLARRALGEDEVRPGQRRRGEQQRRPVPRRRQVGALDEHLGDPGAGAVDQAAVTDRLRLGAGQRLGGPLRAALAAGSG
jgi:hypothetical protein